MAWSPALLEQLTRIAGEAHVLVAAERLEPYSHDETPGLVPVLPAAVVRPGCAAEVAQLLAACRAARVPVVPRGGGTGLSGGCLPVPGGIVLSLERLDRILTISSDDLVAEVQPGVVLKDLHAAVEEQGLFYPPDPGSLDSCTIGGNVAENAGGPRALRYGVTGHYVLGLEVALPSGELLRLGKRTVKGVSGYDLTALLVGSEGTLAVITAITLRLIPRPRHVCTALATFDHASRAAAAITTLLGRGILPRTLEYLDRPSVDALRPTAPFRFPADLDTALIVETDGNDPEATFAELAAALEILTAQGATATIVAQNAQQQRELWASRRGLAEATRRLCGRKLAEDIAVPRSQIPRTIREVAAIGEQHGLRTAIYGHAGDGNLHVQLLFSRDEELPAAQRAVEEVFALAIRLGGTLSGEHGIGVAKRSFMHLEHAPTALALMRQLKQVFDPDGILNPGKIL